jgi:1-acyl-sn-glycerol-3-phosphate acyltransferase
MDFYFAIQSLLIFVFGSILLLFFGFIIFKIFRIKKGPFKDLFHYGMMATSRFLNYSNFLSTVNIIGRKEAMLDKPAVLIANHQSHIDIAIVLMMHPRLLELTNDRVQNSFLYGPLVKMAEFYAVSDGMDLLVEKLRKNVEEGYSVLVFPEGTRSPDTRVQRFHQGAFYLARELGVDILPVIIHGSGHVFPKGEYFLRKGTGTVIFLPRVSPDDKRFQGELLEVSRNFRKYMTDEYRKAVDMMEKPSYFRDKLIKNYIYKGPVLEWYLRVKIRLEKNYKLFHDILPKEGQITDIGCGYGFISYMLSFLSDQRTITGIDYDLEKIETANNAPSKHERINFIHGDVLEMEIQQSKAFILADVLHYFPEEEQEKLLAKCVERLEEGGVIIIRDADRQMEKKHLGTRISEFFSTRIGFNQTRGEDKKLYFTSREKLLKILEKHGLEIEIVDETKMTSNLVFIAKKSAVGG